MLKAEKLYHPTADDFIYWRNFLVRSQPEISVLIGLFVYWANSSNTAAQVFIGYLSNAANMGL